jgi:hypothetical protein
MPSASAWRCRAGPATPRFLACFQRGRGGERDEIGASAGAVGDGAAAEFHAWMQERGLPDPEAVLADPDSFALPHRSDRGRSQGADPSPLPAGRSAAARRGALFAPVLREPGLLRA